MNDSYIPTTIPEDSSSSSSSESLTAIPEDSSSSPSLKVFYWCISCEPGCERTRHCGTIVAANKEDAAKKIKQEREIEIEKACGDCYANWNNLIITEDGEIQW